MHLEIEMTIDDTATQILTDLVEQIENSNRSRPESGWPGHRHQTPGVWDAGNRASIAGKPCQLCAAWERAKQLIKEHNEQSAQC